jgi:nucleoside triphosphate diphosphatase
MLDMDSKEKLSIETRQTNPHTTQSSRELERAFLQAVEIMARLRAPGGCPWDRQQSFDSIRRYTLEETYEVLDAIEKEDWHGLKDELGDLLLQILFYSEMADESGYFTLLEVIDSLNAKLVRRHPHVFAQTTDVLRAGDVEFTWERIKKAERAERVTEGASSILDAVPRGLPALMEASKLGKSAASIGFDWQEIEPVFDKLEEEICELRHAISANPESMDDPRQQEELGDVLFTVTNLARKLGFQAELALRATNAKFRRRFRQMEISTGSKIGNLSASELEALWNNAKSEERKEPQR